MANQLAYNKNNFTKKGKQGSPTRKLHDIKNAKIVKK